MKLTHTLAAALGAVALAALSGAALAADPYKIDVVVPMTGTGRVWGVSESRAPRVMTIWTSSSAARPRISRTNCCHFMFGSMPCTSTMSRGKSGTLAMYSRVLGQVSCLRPSSPVPMCGRFTW